MIKKSHVASNFSALAWIFTFIAILAAIITHWIVCIKAGAWVLLIAGTFVLPVGISHGVASWLGYVWT
jgi:hypothetical protein